MARVACACDAFVLCFEVDVIRVRVELHYCKCPIFPKVALPVTGEVGFWLKGGGRKGGLECSGILSSPVAGL